MVLEVGVLDDDELAGGLLDAAAKRGALAHVFGLEQDPNLWMAGLQLGQNLPRTVV
jgi:hypothetical protein